MLGVSSFGKICDKELRELPREMLLSEFSDVRLVKKWTMLPENCGFHVMHPHRV